MKTFSASLMLLFCSCLLVVPVGAKGATKTNAPTPSPGLIETHPCVPFDDSAVQAATYAVDNKVYSPECNTNNCTGPYGTGCCRYHTSVLSCDSLGFLFPQIPVSDEIWENILMAAPCSGWRPESALLGFKSLGSYVITHNCSSSLHNLFPFRINWHRIYLVCVQPKHRRNDSANSQFTRWYASTGSFCATTTDVCSTHGMFESNTLPVDTRFCQPSLSTFCQLYHLWSLLCGRILFMQNRKS